MKKIKRKSQITYEFIFYKKLGKYLKNRKCTGTDFQSKHFVLTTQKGLKPAQSCTMNTYFIYQNMAL